MSSSSPPSSLKKQKMDPDSQTTSNNSEGLEWRFIKTIEEGVAYSIDFEMAGTSHDSDIVSVGMHAVRFKVGHTRDVEGNESIKAQVFTDVPEPFRRNLYVKDGPLKTEFDDRTWKDFWSKPENKKLLETQFARDPKTLVDGAAQPITSKDQMHFQLLLKIHEHREKMERYAMDRNLKLYFVFDWPVFDASILNHLYAKHKTQWDFYPLPYTAKKQFGEIYDVDQRMEALLAVYEDDSNSNACTSTRFGSTFPECWQALPRCVIENNHLPEMDALRTCYYFVSYRCATLLTRERASRTKDAVEKLQKVSETLGEHLDN